MNYLKKLAEEEERLFMVARTYLMDNFDRRITMDELARETGIERSLINKWLKEGRFNQGREAFNSKDQFIKDLIKSKDDILKKN